MLRCPEIGAILNFIVMHLFQCDAVRGKYETHSPFVRMCKLWAKTNYSNVQVFLKCKIGTNFSWNKNGQKQSFSEWEQFHVNSNKNGNHNNNNGVSTGALLWHCIDALRCVLCRLKRQFWNVLILANCLAIGRVGLDFEGALPLLIAYWCTLLLQAAGSGHPRINLGGKI